MKYEAAGESLPLCGRGGGGGAASPLRDGGGKFGAVKNRSFGRSYHGTKANSHRHGATMKLFQTLTAALGTLGSLQQATGTPIPAYGSTKQSTGLDVETKASLGGAAPRNATVLPRAAELEPRADNPEGPTVSVHQQHAEGFGLFGGSALIAMAPMLPVGPVAKGITAGVGAGTLLVSGVFHQLDSGKPRTGQPADPAGCANVPQQDGLGAVLALGTLLSGAGAYAATSQSPAVRALGHATHIAANIAVGAAATLHGQEVKKPRC